MRAFALANPQTPTKVHLLCDVLADAGEWVEFCVINGGWNGTFYPGSGEAAFGLHDEAVFPAIKVWEGEVPSNFRHCNDAISWINRQIGPANDR